MSFWTLREEALRQQRAALEEHARQLEELELERQVAAQRELEEQKRIIAHADETQSEAKTEKARNLMKAGLYDEALDQAKAVTEPISSAPCFREPNVAASWVVLSSYSNRTVVSAP